MSNTNTGGPAFPTLSEHQAGPTLWQYSGMTLRDYFAAKAMQGLLLDGVGSLADEELADWAYNLADCMLKKREA